MNLREFKKRINKIEDELIRVAGKYGLCSFIREDLKDVLIVNSISPVSHFDIWMSPHSIEGAFKDAREIGGVDGLVVYWLGYKIPENLPRRVDTLRLWEQIVISDKEYLKW